MNSLCKNGRTWTIKGLLGAAYNRADFVEERKRMMQVWADYLDKLKLGLE